MIEGFVSLVDKDLIYSVEVQGSYNAANVFLQRSSAILEKYGDKYQEAMNKIASLETEASNAMAAFTGTVETNHQLLSRVDNVFCKID